MPMQADFPELKVLFKGELRFEDMPGLPMRTPFAPDVLRLLAALSVELRKRPDATQYPDIMAFAFFIRHAQLKRFMKTYHALREGSLGRGVTFHIAPSNVPINFAYTLAIGLLSGNACIVRVSEKEFPQVPIIVDGLRTVLAQAEHRELRDCVAVVRYGHDARLNAFFSSLCDVRVIWGGDRTIAEIRQAPLPPQAYEMVFSDRFSALIINAETYLASSNSARVADDFYNDTYQFDQGACSSPRLIYWMGEPQIVASAQKQFWGEVLQSLKRKNYSNEPVRAVEKYLTVCRAAINTGTAKKVSNPDNRIVRIALHTTEIDLADYDCLGGVFFEYVDSGLEHLAPVITRKFQTLTYLGFDPLELRQLLMQQGVSGVDRIVPLGNAASFSLTWDGYDVIRHLSRMLSA